SLGGGHTADLSAIASGGSGSYTYQWSNGGGTESITVDEPGTYSIVVTDNVSGCVVSGQIDLEGADPPALFIDTSPGSEICATDFSDGITLQASTAGGSGNFSYSWTDGTDGASTFAQSTGSLGLTVVDEQSGCVVTASPVDFIVHPPINIDIIPDSGTELCASGPSDGLTFTGLVSGGSGDFAYSWSNGDFDVSAFMPSSGSLALTVIDNQSGCTAEAQPVEVIIHEPINVEFFIDNGPEICAASADDGINLSATPAGGSGDYQFNWGNGEEGPTTLVQSTGSVGLTVIDQQTGCSTDVQSPLLTIHPPLDISILADAPTALCENSDQWPIELAVSSSSGSGSFSYSWSTGSSESSISVDDGGDYTLQLIDLVTGCEGSTALTITSLALPEISLTGPATACLSEQVCLDVQPLGGSWSNPNIIGNCLDLSTSNEGIQIVDYTYTDTNGCTSSAAYQFEAFAPPALPQVNCTSTTASVIFDWPETDGYTYQVNGEPWNGGPYQVDGLVPEQEVTISLAVSTEGPCTPVTQTYQCATEACPPISVELTTDLSQAFCANDLPGQPIQLGIEIIGDDSQLGNGSWSGPGLIDINQGIIDLAQANLGLGEHIYTFTYQWSNCSYSTAQSLRIAAPPIVDAGEDQIVGCDFEQIDLLGEASSLSQIVWLDASGQQIGSALNQPITETGLYQIRATDPETNCFALDQVLVSEIEDQPEDVEITINPETCYGDGDSRIEVLQVFGGTAPYVYELDNEPQGFEGRWTGLEPAVYSLRIVDDMGCELWTEIDLPGRRPLLVELEEEVELIAGEEHAISLELPQDEQVVANWYPEIGIECMDASCLDVMLSPYFSQVYTVEVINDRGCMAVDEVSIIVKDGNAVYLPNAFSPNEDGQNDEFMIYPLQEEVRVSQRSIYDRWGNLVSGGSSSAQADQHYIWDGRHAGQMCNVGVYIYQVELTMPDGDKEVVTGEITLVR
ncbi:MAG: gliding motility-associated C-terminal domain-containing protein, partial [Bacteroidota bacterium]